MGWAWMFAPGMMYLGRAGPSKTMEFTPLLLSLIGTEEGEVEVGETKTAGRIGPSKMSTHSLTFSLLGDLGLGCCIKGLLITPGGGGGWGRPVDGVMGNNWACLEIEDE